MPWSVVDENLQDETMKIPYFPGCTLKTAAKHFETSAIAVARALDIDLVELERWNCCGTVTSLTSDDLMHHLAPIRNLIRVEAMQKNGGMEDENRLVVLCSMCFHVLKRSHLRAVENDDEMEKLNNFMYLEENYQGKVKVVHFLELLKEIGYEAVTERVKRPLEGLKAAPYYGCLSLRPKETGIDDPDDPTIQADLLAALGAEAIDNPLKTRCCGSYQTVRDRYAVADLTHDILSRARKAGADCVITSCPLCMFNLEERQKEVKEKYPGFESMPVIYFTQLMALSFGLDESVCRFDQNHVDPRPLLKETTLLM